MKIINENFKVNTSKLFDFINLEDKINDLIREQDVQNGFCLIRVPHTSAGLVVTERDPAVRKDFIRNLKRILPKNQNWEHSYEGAINARSHQAAALLGNSHWAPIINSALSLGNWQGIFLVELFEPRRRQVQITIMSA